MAYSKLPTDHIRMLSVANEKTIKQAGRNGQMSQRMVDALKGLDESDDYDSRLGCTKYYRIQSNQELGSEQIKVPIWFDVSLDSSWFSPLRDGMDAINAVAPGLCMYVEDDKAAAKIQVLGNGDDGCWTLYNIVRYEVTTISLQGNWPGSKNGTAIHEMMHALGFAHEHKREDGENYLEYKTTDSQYKVGKDMVGLSRFDPHSIMMYSTCGLLQRKTDGDLVWRTKTGCDRCQVLSELDKVGLNILYRPVCNANYNPRTSSVTGLFYCDRPTFRDTENDIVKRTYSDGHCGPTNGPNCAACRVLKTSKSDRIFELGKWQGWTGRVYCGEYFECVSSYHDGYCGPNNGPTCKKCWTTLNG